MLVGVSACVCVCACVCAYNSLYGQDFVLYKYFIYYYIIP